MSSKPKIAYFGADPICLPGLRYLTQEASGLCDIALVVAQPARRTGRGKRLQQNPVAAFAETEGLELLQPETPDAAVAERLSGLGLDLAFVMAYGHFLTKAVREAPAHGMLNFHASILPAYRGASPLETALAMGELETGVCLMRVVREMDAGPVADCERITIKEVDTSPDLRRRAGEAVVPLLRRNLEAALAGQLNFREQVHESASFCRKIRKEDAALDFFLPAHQLALRLRAFTPWPGGYFEHAANRIKVGAASVSAGELTAPPGTVLRAENSLDVATGQGVLEIHELQRPGGRMLPVVEFLRGYRIESGTVLPSVSGEALLRSESV